MPIALIVLISSLSLVAGSCGSSSKGPESTLTPPTAAPAPAAADVGLQKSALQHLQASALVLVEDQCADIEPGPITDFVAEQEKLGAEILADECGPADTWLQSWKEDEWPEPDSLGDRRCVIEFGIRSEEEDGYFTTTILISVQDGERIAILDCYEVG